MVVSPRKMRRPRLLSGGWMMFIFVFILRISVTARRVLIVSGTGKVGDEWEGVVYRHINKDNVDDTEDALKCISGLLGRDANNEDMF